MTGLHVTTPNPDEVGAVATEVAEAMEPILARAAEYVERALDLGFSEEVAERLGACLHDELVKAIFRAEGDRA